MYQNGNEIFGIDYCNTNHEFEMGGDALTNWTCRLCEKSGVNPDTNVPEICSTCSLITNRCNKCGKLNK